MPTAIDIDQAIEFSARNVADISALAGTELLDRLDQWIAAMFPPGAIVGAATPTEEPRRPVRTVADWDGPTLLAREVVVAETPPALTHREALVAVTGYTINSESAVTDTLSRTLWAVKYATINGDIAAGVEANVVAAYNAAWT